MMMFLFQIIEFFRKYLRDQQDNVHQPVFIGKITPTSGQSSLGFKATMSF
jgi:hypothetical protein